LSDFSTDELKLAFGYHMARLILETDAVITHDEKDFLERLWPRSAVEAAGFLASDGGVTPKLTEAMRMAVDELPYRLSTDGKFELLRSLMSAVMADGVFESEEGGVFLQAAKLLGLPDERVDELLDSLDDVGSLDLPEPEAE